MTRTRFLLTLLVVVILLQLFPDRSAMVEWIAVVAVAVYSIIWLGTRYWAQFRRQRSAAAQAAADDREYAQYETELASIRARYDTGSGDTSPAYRGELSALQDRHREMLARRFGSR